VPGSACSAMLLIIAVGVVGCGGGDNNNTPAGNLYCDGDGDQRDRYYNLYGHGNGAVNHWTVALR